MVFFQFHLCCVANANGISGGIWAYLYVLTTLGILFLYRGNPLWYTVVILSESIKTFLVY